MAHGAAWNGAQHASYSQTPPQQPADEWCQAFDPTSGHFYYYCEAKQLTQWEAPEGGYRPAPEAWWIPQASTVSTVEDRSQSQAIQSTLEGPSGGQQRDEATLVAAAPIQEQSVEAIPHTKTASDSAVELLSIQEAVSSLDSTIAVEEIETTSELLPREKVKPRMETTGLMPDIPQPDPGQHTRFGSSSSEEIPKEGEEEESQHPQQYQDTAAAAAAAGTHEVVHHQNSGLQHARRRRPRRFTGRDGPGDALPHRLHKYWLQRYSIFSRYDDGIVIDEEGWYSATPEVISWHHAKRAVAATGGSSKCLAVDCFGGTGCNAIQMALAGCHVVAVEMDPHKAALLQHNARVYGVENRVEVICADFLKVAPRIKADVVFMSPPWGGPEYSHYGDFDVESMGGHPELGLTKLLEIVFGPMECRAVMAWLPRNSSLKQVEAAAAVVPEELGGDACEVERATLNGVTKAITVYYGTAARCRGHPSK